MRRAIVYVRNDDAARRRRARELLVDYDVGVILDRVPDEYDPSQHEPAEVIVVGHRFEALAARYREAGTEVVYVDAGADDDGDLRPAPPASTRIMPPRRRRYRRR